ncbi:esterase/lipase family protein, partial [Arcticibacter eurypsychrophilus]|uniref:esterase/lipase family protein n=1 Tax=Arcticibacter eurypsychrophilus TaxID=1434752 RepID=UPI000ADB51E6
YDNDKSRTVAKIYDQNINEQIRVDGVDVRLGDQLRRDGYDIIVYDYKDGSDLIEKNALAVVKLLETLNTTYSSTLQKKFVVIGPSMGALVAQYALAYAEKTNKNVNTRLYISFDGPHQGANGAIGLQQLLQYISSKGLGSVVFKSLKNGAHRGSAARQMLVANAGVSGESPTPDNYRNIFLSNLASVGTYPNATNDTNKIRKIAIINGSKNLTPNTLLQPNGEILFMQVKRSGLLGLINGRLGDRLNINITASPSLGRSATSDIWLFKPLINIALWQPPRVINYGQPAVNNFSYDTAIGSRFTDPVDDKTEGWIDITQKLLYLFAGNKSKFRHNINATFMPTTSAIDLQVPNFTLAYDFSNENIVCNKKTPFDRVYAPNENQSHVKVTPENITWFESEIKFGDPNLGPELQRIAQPDGAYTVSGPSTFCGSATYQVNIQSGMTVKWSATGSISIPGNSTSSSVTVNSVSGGAGTLLATMTSACGQSSATKNINVGIVYSVNYSASTGGYGTITPGSSPSVTRGPTNSNYYLSVFTQGNGYTYAWSIQGGSGYSYVNLNGANAGFYLSGSNAQIVLSLTVTNPACGSSNAFILIFTAGSPTMAKTQSSFTIFPNPSSNEITISLKDDTQTVVDQDAVKIDKPFEYKIYNKTGVIVKQGKSRDGKDVKVDVGNIPDDNYFLHVIIDKE